MQEKIKKPSPKFEKIDAMTKSMGVLESSESSDPESRRNCDNIKQILSMFHSHSTTHEGEGVGSARWCVPFLCGLIILNALLIK